MDAVMDPSYGFITGVSVLRMYVTNSNLSFSSFRCSSVFLVCWLYILFEDVVVYKS